jgi:hypothetical protein
MGSSLAGVQRCFATVITDPTSVEGAPEVDDIERAITPGPRLSALERVEIYRRAYWARLVECLANDFPALRYSLGTDAFESLCRAYIARHPSTSPSLNAYGRHMESFCRERADASPLGAFAADLAALEWAMVEVVHAAAASALSVDALQRIVPADWGEVRLVPSPTVRVLRFRYPVNAYFQAFVMDESPAIPAPAPSATAVSRSDFAVERMDLTAEMADLLEDLFSGRRLGEALACKEIGAEAERNVMVWFRAWVSAGFFAQVE